MYDEKILSTVLIKFSKRIGRNRKLTPEIKVEVKAILIDVVLDIMSDDIISDNKKKGVG